MYLRFFMLFLPSFYRGTFDQAGSLEKETQEAARYSRGENRSLTVFVSIQLSSLSIRSMLDTLAYNEAPIPGEVALQRDQSQFGRRDGDRNLFTICAMPRQECST